MVAKKAVASAAINRLNSPSAVAWQRLMGLDPLEAPAEKPKRRASEGQLAALLPPSRAGATRCQLCGTRNSRETSRPRQPRGKYATTGLRLRAPTPQQTTEIAVIPTRRNGV